MHIAARRLVFAAVLVSGLGWGLAIAAPRPAPTGQAVALPYVMRDSLGVQWDVQMDGSIGDGGNDLYDGGGRLTLNNAVYQGQNPQAVFDAATGELTMPPVQVNGLNVTRKIAVSVAQSWCRWTEVIENPAAQPIHLTMHLHWDLGGAVQQFQAIEDEKKKAQLGVAIFDGQRGIVMLCAGRGGKVTSRYQMQQNNDQIEQFYEIDVPAKQTVAIVHLQAMRASLNDAVAFIQTAKDKDILEGVSKEVRNVLINFKRSGSLLGNIELPRTELLDIVDTKGGDQYRGTLKDAVFHLDTFHGPVDLPADRVIGMLTAGTYRPIQLFITSDGEIVGGALAGESLRLQLSSGQVIALPLSQIARVGCRKRPGEPEEFKFDKPMAYLNDGQRIAVEAPAGGIAVATIYGNVKLEPQWIAALILSGEEQAVHQIRLRDGSRFNGLIQGDSIELRLRGAGSSANGSNPPSVKFPLASLSRVQLSPSADETADEEETPALRLNNGDMLVGTTSGTLELETGFDVLKLNATEIRRIRHVEAPEGGRALPAEVSVTLWDGASVSGRLRGDAVEFALKSGQPIHVPVSLIARYAHPNPPPPAEMLQRIKAIVGELSNPDWKKRERAAEQLRTLGQGAAGVLKDLRGSQAPEAQKLIDTILKTLEQERAAAAKAAGQTAAPPLQVPIQMQEEGFQVQQGVRMHQQFDR
jgi:hypothetical protein